MARRQAARRLERVCRGPDDMTHAAALAGTRLDLVHGETHAAEAAGERRIRRRRPDGQQPIGPQRPARSFKAVQVVKAIIRAAAEAVGTVVNVEKDSIEACAFRRDDVTDITLADADP